MSRFLVLAYKLTSRSTHPRHHMAAIVIRGGSVVATAHNTSYYGGHCERRALRSHQDVTGATLIVVRSNGGVSRPCSKCRKAIEDAGIRKLVFVDEARIVRIERIYKETNCGE
jgi:deoxycytidylate deaminase